MTAELATVRSVQVKAETCQHDGSAAEMAALYHLAALTSDL